MKKLTNISVSMPSRGSCPAFMLGSDLSRVRAFMRLKRSGGIGRRICCRRWNLMHQRRWRRLDVARKSIQQAYMLMCAYPPCRVQIPASA
jgi:hypothetical protein